MAHGTVAIALPLEVVSSSAAASTATARTIGCSPLYLLAECSGPPVVGLAAKNISCDLVPGDPLS